MLLDFLLSKHVALYSGQEFCELYIKSHTWGSVESGFNRSHRILANYLHYRSIVYRSLIKTCCGRNVMPVGVSYFVWIM
jgi:hypothetical protein